MGYRALMDKAAFWVALAMLALVGYGTLMITADTEASYRALGRSVVRWIFYTGGLLASSAPIIGALTGKYLARHKSQRIRILLGITVWAVLFVIGCVLEALAVETNP